MHEKPVKLHQARTAMMRDLLVSLSLAATAAFASAPLSTKTKPGEPADLATAFCLAWGHHDAAELRKLFLPNADFVNVGALWLHGSDFETFHSRLFKGRFQTSRLQPLLVKVRYIRPDVAVIRWSWRMEVALANGSLAPARFGLMMMIAEKHEKHWLISDAQNTNSGPAIPEAEGLKLPIEVPRAP